MNKRNLKEYSTIKELMQNLEDFWNAKIIDGWVENNWWISVLGGSTSSVKNEETGEWKNYQKGCIILKNILPI